MIYSVCLFGIMQLLMFYCRINFSRKYFDDKSVISQNANDRFGFIVFSGSGGDSVVKNMI